MCAPVSQRRRQRFPRRRGLCRREVPGGGDPTVAKPSNASQAGLGAPASDPDGRSSRLDRPRLHRWLVGVVPARHGRRPWREVGPQEAHGIIQARPPLIECHTGCLVVPLGGTRPDTENESTAREDVQRCCGLGQDDGTPEHGQCHRRREAHAPASFKHARQRHDAVEPRSMIGQMIVRADETKPKVARRGGQGSKLAGPPPAPIDVNEW